MLRKNLSIKDRYNFRGLKFDDEVDFKKPKSSLREITGMKTEKTPFSVIKYGLKNESSAKTMEKDNTLIFICESNSTKPMIKEAIEKIYGKKIMKVNTLNMFKKHAKKAFVRFHEEGAAVEVATKAGIL